MRRAAAQIEAWDWCAITAGAGKGTMVAHLAAGKRADQQISASHVGQGDFSVGWAEHKLICDDAAAKIRRPFAPQLEQSRAVSIFLSCPVRRVAAQGVGQFLP